MRVIGLALLGTFLNACGSETLPPERSNPPEQRNDGSGGGVSAAAGQSFGGAVGVAGYRAVSGGMSGQFGSGGSSGRAGNGATSGASDAASGGSTAGGGAAVAGGGASAAGSGGQGDDAGEQAIAALRAHLALERAKRPAIVEQDFAKAPLDAAQAKTAQGLLWDDHVAFIRASRKAETDSKSITLDGKALRYDFKVFGTKPANGRSLYLSLHGGGEAAASVNDEQWENQKGLYKPAEGVYLAPRAPTNTWNLWHEPHIDDLFQRLIEDMIVFQEVDPNKVYVMGYSAGGDGVYQLGPRMADSWAAAAMMAGHPNDAQPDSLRNIGFTIHVGALDTAFERNTVASDWDALLDALEAKDPDGYEHEVQVHAGKPHWMDLEDAVAVPWMAGFTRNPVPRRVVWLQDDVVHDRFYWLAVPPEQAKKAARIEASFQAQTVTLAADGVTRVKVRLSDAMLDLDQSIDVVDGGTTLFSGRVSRTIGALATTLSERGDPALVFPAELEVAIP